MKNKLRTYDNVQKITIGQGDDYITNYPSFKEKHKLTVIGLSKQLALDSDSKAKKIKINK